jgi:hypothetical protein
LERKKFLLNDKLLKYFSHSPATKEGVLQNLFTENLGHQAFQQINHEKMQIF